MTTRIIHSDDGTLADITAEMRDYYSGTKALTWVAAEDKLFIGSPLPFTRKYIKPSSANAVTAAVTVKYWDGTQFRTAANVIDETVSVAGKSLSGSGYLSFTPDKRYPWVKDDTVVNGTTKVTGLGSVTLYDLYWIQLTFDGAVAATLAWVGDLFCTDNDLGSEYPVLDRTNVKTAWEAGKTEWEEQRVAASERVISDLKSMEVTASPGLILDVDQLRRPCISKTAEIIFNGLGQGYADSFTAAQTEYKKRMADSKLFVVDRNQNGVIDASEVGLTVSRMTR